MSLAAKNLLGLFGRPESRSPAWLPGGMFAFPPRGLWRSLSPEEAGRAWAQASRGRFQNDPLGLYVHFPAELDAVLPGPSRGRHPYLDCLDREVGLLKLPRRLPVRTLYLGGGGSGSLARLSSKDLRALLLWLRARFRLGRLEQSVAELDAAELTAEKVRVLLDVGGIDRFSVFMPAREDGAGWRERRRRWGEGVRLCRALGVRHLAIDLIGRSAGHDGAWRREDLRWARSLGADGIFHYDGASPNRRKALVNNLQLEHGGVNASVLALGWGAVAHTRDRLLYSKEGNLWDYVEALRSGTLPLAGSPMTPEDERRYFLVHGLEDTGGFSRESFERIFGVPPEEVFPREFAALRSSGSLTLTGDRFEVASGLEKDRYRCSVWFYGAPALRALAASVTRQAPEIFNLIHLSSKEASR